MTCNCNSTKDEYKYILQYVDTQDGVTVTHEFSACICIEDLGRYLKDFLCGCEWDIETIAKILDIDETRQYREEADDEDL